MWRMVTYMVQPHTGLKLGNAGPPEKIFLDGDTKERASKGQCQARGV